MRTNIVPNQFRSSVWTTRKYDGRANIPLTCPSYRGSRLSGGPVKTSGTVELIDREAEYPYVPRISVKYSTVRRRERTHHYTTLVYGRA